METLIKFVMAWLAEGNLYEVNTEDGIALHYDYYVMVEGEDGHCYIHGRKFRYWEKAGAEKLLEQVVAAGKINAEHWMDVGKPRSLQQQWAEAAEREQFERAYGQGWD